MLDTYYKIQELPKEMWPEKLREIPQPPEKLYIRGLANLERMINNNYKFICIVGSRKNTDYGDRVCKKILRELQNEKVCIVSGLAYGLDSIAHREAINLDLPTIAFPGSGLDIDVIYPRGHVDLATQILQGGGCLISEFENDMQVRPWFFKQRNRLMAGISEKVILIEASEKSGSVMTANFAIEYNTDLLCVPGSIFNSQSDACNYYISQGAKVVREGKDILS